VASTCTYGIKLSLHASFLFLSASFTQIMKKRKLYSLYPARHGVLRTAVTLTMTGVAAIPKNMTLY